MSCLLGRRRLLLRSLSLSCSPLVVGWKQGWWWCDGGRPLVWWLETDFCPAAALLRRANCEAVVLINIVIVRRIDLVAGWTPVSSSIIGRSWSFFFRPLLSRGAACVIRVITLQQRRLRSSHPMPERGICPLFFFCMCVCARARALHSWLRVVVLSMQFPSQTGCKARQGRCCRLALF
jgi:hypothetical protein